MLTLGIVTFSIDVLPVNPINFFVRPAHFMILLRMFVTGHGKLKTVTLKEDVFIMKMKTDFNLEKTPLKGNLWQNQTHQTHPTRNQNTIFTRIEASFFLFSFLFYYMNLYLPYQYMIFFQVNSIFEMQLYIWNEEIA